MLLSPVSLKPPANHEYQYRYSCDVDSFEVGKSAIDRIVEALIHACLGGLIESEHVKDGVVNVLIDLLLEVGSLVDILLLLLLQLGECLEGMSLEECHRIDQS